jgi:ligand-binding sensor domain-containing protein
MIMLLFFTALLQAQPEYRTLLDGAEIAGITDDGKDIWIATYGAGVYRYNTKTTALDTFNTKAKNLTNDFFYSIAASDKYVWAGSGDGLFFYDKKKKRWSKRKFALGGEYGNWIRSLYYDNNDDKLYIGRFINLSVFDGKRKRYYDYDLTRNGDAKTNNIKAIGKEGNKYIWFGTEAGVFRYDKSKKLDQRGALEYINNSEGDFPNAGEFVSISDFAFDDNYIWFATDEFVTADDPTFNLGGLYRYNRKATWSKFDRRDGFPSNGMLKLAVAGLDVWVSVYSFDNINKAKVGNGLYLIDRISGEVRRVDPETINLTSTTITALYFDGTSMWIGTDMGLRIVKLTNPLGTWKGPKKKEMRK